MDKVKIEPTNIQPNLDNRNETLKGCEENTYNSEPPDIDPFFLFFGC